MITTLEANKKITVDGMPMTIEKMNMSVRQIYLLKDTGYTFVKSFDEFMHEYKEGKIVLKSSVSDEDLDPDTTKRTISSVPENVVDEAKRRLGYIKSCLDDNNRVITNVKERNKRIREHMLETKDSSRLSERQVMRLYYRWNAKDRRLDSLFHNKKGRGNRTSKLTPEQMEFINETVIPMYMSPNRPTISGVYEWAMALLQTKDYAHIDAFSRSTLDRQIKKIDKYKMCIAREGWHAAKRNFPHGSMVVKPMYLLEKVELDHTPINLELVSEETGEVMGRAWLTLLIDVASRMILGYHLSFNSPSAKSVILAVKHAALAKDNIINSDPYLKGYEWPCFGLFSELSIDNGSDLHAKVVRSALANLGVDVHYNPKARPNYKGAVERVLRTINDDPIQFMPGRTFAHFLEKGDYNAKKNASLTLSDLAQVLNNWIVTIYHQNVHRQLKDTPLNTWKRLELGTPAIRIPPSVEDFDRLIWKQEKKKLQKYGIQINCRFYQSVELQNIAKKIGHHKFVDAFVDESDLSVVYVRIPGTEDFIDVPMRDSNFAQLRLNKSDHYEAIKKAREMYPSINHNVKLSDEQLVAGWNEIVRIRDQAILHKKKSIRIAEEKRNKKSDKSTKEKQKSILNLDDDNEYLEFKKGVL